MMTDFEKQQQIGMYKTMPYVLLRMLTELSYLIAMDGKDGKIKMPDTSLTVEQINAMINDPNNRAKHYISIMAAAIVTTSFNEDGALDNNAITAFVHSTIEQIIAGDNLFPQALTEVEQEQDEDDDEDDEDAFAHIDEQVRQAVGQFYNSKNELDPKNIPRSLRQDLYAILPIIKIDELARPQLHQMLAMVYKHQGVMTKMENVGPSKVLPHRMEGLMELHLIMRNLHEVIADLLHDHAMITTPATRIFPGDAAKLALGMIQEVKEFGHKFMIERLTGAINDIKGSA